MRAKRSIKNTFLMLIPLLHIPPRLGLAQEGPSLCTEFRPDLCPLEDRLYENFVWYDAGKTYLRLSNSIANVGVWQLFIEPAGPVNPQTGKRPARQKTLCITVDDDTLYKYYPVGEFEYHSPPCHEHLHLGRIARYALRQYTGLNQPPGSPGPIGEKVGFCLLDSDPYECTSCCGPVQGTAPSGAVFTACPEDINSQFAEGISIGWQDTYDYKLDDQWIDLENVVPGRYWLQSVVDPDRVIKQTSASNDTALIPIFLALKDLYEPNDSREAVDGMPIGGLNSSNLSACQTIVDNLSIHREYIQEPTYPCFGDTPGDVDYFKIYFTDRGGSEHKVKIVFGDSSQTAFKDGNLDMELLDFGGGLLTRADTDDDDEEISLENKSPGTYYVKVYGRNAVILPSGLSRPNSNYYYRLELTLPEPVCGDVNGDGQINNADILVLGNCCPTCNGGNVPCHERGDVDGDCDVDCADRDILIDYVYLAEPLPENACSCP